jgi:hypothetical protein
MTEAWIGNTRVNFPGNLAIRFWASGPRARETRAPQLGVPELFEAFQNAVDAQPWVALIDLWRHCPEGKASAKRLTSSGAFSNR